MLGSLYEKSSVIHRAVCIEVPDWPTMHSIVLLWSKGLLLTTMASIKLYLASPSCLWMVPIIRRLKAACQLSKIVAHFTDMVFL